LTVGILFLSAAIGSSQQLTTLARQKIVAQNAIQAYIERMRQYYPDQNSTDMSNFLTDQRTPKDFLPTSGLESKILKNVESYVVKTTYEGGGGSSQTVPWNYFTTPTTGITAPTNMTVDDKAALAMTSGRDLDGDGTISAAAP